MSSPERLEREFPLFPLGLVALPSETVPLHIFEERYKTMVALCLAEEREFGIVWMADDGLREVGCAVTIDELLETLEDGRMNIVCEGTRALRIHERQSHLPYPSGVVELLEDTSETTDEELAAETRTTYGQLVARAAGKELEADELSRLGAYEMAATVEFGLEAKQGLLELRSENARLDLALRLFRAAFKRLEFVDLAQTRAKSNGKLRF